MPKLRELVKASNPVATPARLMPGDEDIRFLFEEVMNRARNPRTSTGLLDATVERRRDMQTQDKPIQVAPTPQPPSRKRWLFPALAGAATVIIAIVVTFALLSGDDEPDVTNNAPQPSPTETTIAADVTVAPEVAAVVSSYEAMNNGDIDGYLALFTEEAAVEGRDFLQVLVNMNSQSESAEPCRLIEPTPSGEARVSCTVTFSDDFHGPGGLTTTVTETFVVTDADKISLRFTAEGNFELNFAFNAAFWEWLMVAHPEVHADIAPLGEDGLPGAGDLRGEPDDMLVALEYVDEFVAQSDDYPINP